MGIRFSPNGSETMTSLGRKGENIKSFDCKLCGRAFRLKHHLITHSRLHSNDKPYKCLMCNQSYKQVSNLIAHQAHNHAKGNKYKCETCGKLYATKGVFLRHSLIHQGKLFKCEDCGARFSDISNLHRHRQKHQNLLTCDTCNKSIPGKIALSRHMKTHISKSEACTKCNKSVGSLYMNHHQRYAHGLKGFSCPLCTKEFSKRSHLVLHRQRACKPQAQDTKTSRDG
ncbi:hypothetical protein AAMO2058_000595800 [Amorphochlora amoebiformis]